jgi:hypothetical protein
MIGTSGQFSGDVTTLNVIGPRAPAAIERMVGYRPGRLARGYYVLLLTQPLGVDDFDFAGTTLRSGGRMGLPGASTAADSTRLHVSDRMRQEMGEQEYLRNKRLFLGRAQLKGPERLAKVFPVDGHGTNFSPEVEYPMGGGSGQWTIRKDRAKTFLIAMQVTPELQAITANFSVSLALNQPVQQLYDGRSKIARYLAQA